MKQKEVEWRGRGLSVCFSLSSGKKSGSGPSGIVKSTPDDVKTLEFDVKKLLFARPLHFIRRFARRDAVAVMVFFLIE